MTNPRIMEAVQTYVWADSSEASIRAQRQRGTTGKHSRSIIKRDRRDERDELGLIWFVWSIWSVWFNQINETNQTHKPNQLAPLFP